VERSLEAYTSLISFAETVGILIRSFQKSIKLGIK